MVNKGYVIKVLNQAISLVYDLLPEGQNRILRDSNLGRIYGQLIGMANDIRRDEFSQEQLVQAGLYASGIIFVISATDDSKTLLLEVEEKNETLIKEISTIK